MTISIVLGFLSCKFHIYPAALTCQSHSQYSLEDFLSVCFMVIAFNLKTAEKESPFQMGHPFSRPSVFQFQNPYFNNKLEQNFLWRLGYKQQCLPCSQPTRAQLVWLTRQSFRWAPEWRWWPPCQALVLFSEGLPCARERNIKGKDTLLPSVSIDWSQDK